jgi:hypothetical protein
MRRFVASVCLVGLLAGLLVGLPRGRADDLGDPLGYPGSYGDTAPSAPPLRRADEPQAPAGLDPVRAPEFAKDPTGLLVWHREPAPAAPCDLNLVDPAWMGPGELAYRLAEHRRGCSRDHTRAFRSEFLGRLWVAGDYLLWATSPQRLPALVTASPAGTPPGDIGILGGPGTSVLFGDTDAVGPMRSGGRLRAGYWWDPRQEQGIEAGWFGLTNATTAGAFTATGGDPWLARPFVDATTGLPAAIVVPPPGTLPDDPALLAQQITARQSAVFSGVDVLYRHGLACDRFHRRWLVGGYRFLMLDDTLGITQVADIGSGTPDGLPSSAFTATDGFRTLNRFNGGDIGIIERWWRDRTSLQLTGRMAFGASSISNQVAGETVTTSTTASPDGPQTLVTGRTPGGLLAQPTNMGRRDDAVFAVVGEFGALVDYALWAQCRLSLGYTFLWWSDVGRAAALVDPQVNPSQFGGGELVGPEVPGRRFTTTDFWAQGVSIGLEYQF